VRCEQPASRSLRWRFGPLALALLALAACAQTPSLAPEAAPATAAAGPGGVSVQGLEVEVVPDRWRYDPRDLPERVTPVRVRVVNRRAEPILVSLTDASLVEEGGAPRVAMTPGEAVQASLRDRNGTIGGSRGIGIGGIGIQLGGVGVGGPGWGVGTSGVPIGRGPGEAEGGMDALRVGIRPGRLDPGASLEGYLFFDKPLHRRDRERRFRLLWAFRPLVPMGSPPAPPLATAEIPMVAR